MEDTVSGSFLIRVADQEVANYHQRQNQPQISGFSKLVFHRNFIMLPSRFHLGAILVSFLLFVGADENPSTKVSSSVMGNKLLDATGMGDKGLVRI